MNKDLAQHLKDSGFPQGEANDGVFEKCKNRDDMEHYVEFYFPTLSELIEACGDVGLLLKNRKHYKDWICDAFVNGDIVRSIGDTPEEAVIKLWLELKQ